MWLHIQIEFENAFVEKDKKHIEKIINDVCKEMSQFLTTEENIRIIVDNREEFTLDHGTWWSCFSKDIIDIHIKQNENISHHIDVWLPRTLTHELAHAERWASVWYGNTLYEAILSEWLACNFERIMDIYWYKWWFEEDKKKLDAIINLLPKENITYDDTLAEHNKRFHGTTDEVPKNAWYNIGNNIVEIYLKKHGKKIEDMLNMPFSEIEWFLEEYLKWTNKTNHSSKQ